MTHCYYYFITGAVVPIPAGVHTLTVCATGGGLNVDYLKFKVSSVDSQQYMHTHTPHDDTYTCRS
jgi:hypothetical protein